MFRSCEANSGTISRKGLEDLATSSASAVDLSNLGQAPKPEAWKREGSIKIKKKSSKAKIWVAIHSTPSGFWRRFYFLETFKRIFFQVWVQVWAEQSTSTGSDPEG